MKLIIIAHKLKVLFENLIINIVKRMVKVTDKMVFISYPDYSDNALALSEYILRHDDLKKYRIYWVVDEPSLYNKNCCSKVEFLAKRNRLGFTPLKTIKEHLQAKYLFATHAFLIPEECSNKDQNYILLWHGCGFKTKVGTNYTLFDKALVPGSLFVESKSRYWNVSPDKILDKGYPRYDWMLHPSEEAKKYFGLLKNGYFKVVFWMPTFRNSVSNKAYPEDSISQFPILAKKEDWNELNCYLSSHNILLVLKLHNSQKAYSIPFENYTNVKVLNNKDLEMHGVKLYELFPFSDGLITDYSSVSFDYLVVDKPIGYTLDDFEKYKSTRGFIFDNPLEYMPGHHIYNFQDLRKYLIDIVMEVDDYNLKRDNLRSIAVNVNKESYCKQIINCLEIV